MRVIKDNIWNYGENCIICIPTNGFVKKNGCGVMGRGLAKECLNIFPGIDKKLGEGIITNGNIPFELAENKIYSFPVKPNSDFIFEEKDYDKIISGHRNKIQNMSRYYNSVTTIPGWMCKARLDIIESSAKKLLELFIEKNLQKFFVLPKVGCGNGELNWMDVEPILDKYLNDIAIIVDRN